MPLRHLVPFALLVCVCALADTPRPLRILAASASDHDGENQAGNTIDGLPSTRWATGSKGATLTLDLGETATVALCRIRWVARQGRFFTYDLQVSTDGEAWQTVGEGLRSTSAKRSFEDYPLPNVEARFLRLVCHGNNENSWTHIDEVALLGTGGLPPPADAPPELPESALVRVGDEDSFSGLGYYGTSPESPDGRRIAYVRFLQPPTSGRAAFPAELWVCDRDLTNRRKLADIPRAGGHNTAMPLWVGNHRIAYEVAYHKTYLVDADTGADLLGTIDAQLQHNTHGSLFLVCLNRADAEPETRGLYTVNADTGERRLVLPALALQPFAERLGQPDLSKYVLQHGQWSTDGSHLAVKIYGGKGKDWPLVTCRADGTDLLWFGHKPMHFQWFDGDTIFGHDSEVEDGLPDNRELRRWRRDGTVVETLSGYGCHPSMSPDRQWIATETWYGSDPIYLMLYRRGSLKPDRILATLVPGTTVWELHAHVNPAFSPDGKRLYFNRPVRPGISQAHYVEIE
jgi:hypothetical protein